MVKKLPSTSKVWWCLVAPGPPKKNKELPTLIITRPSWLNLKFVYPGFNGQWQPPEITEIIQIVAAAVCSHLSSNCSSPPFLFFVESSFCLVCVGWKFHSIKLNSTCLSDTCQQLLHSCNTWLPAWTDTRRRTSQGAKRVKLYHVMVITNLLRYWT